MLCINGRIKAMRMFYVSVEKIYILSSSSICSIPNNPGTLWDSRLTDKRRIDSDDDVDGKLNFLYHTLPYRPERLLADDVSLVLRNILRSFFSLDVRSCPPRPAI